MRLHEWGTRAFETGLDGKEKQRQQQVLRFAKDDNSKVEAAGEIVAVMSDEEMEWELRCR